ncbi:MAG: zinc-binding domain-containing protein [Flavobacteriaceae bacterium]|nr:zinc-binding domain-containing protein [Flavobacteriaceae bacterium]
MSTVGFDPMVVKCADQAFDMLSAKTKQFYKLLLTTKAKLPNMSKRLIADFGVEDMLDQIYLLPHFVASETYIWSFQYRLLNYILFTNVKLLKIGFALTDKCTFCNSYEETFYHLFFECSHVQAFWRCFVNWWADVADEKLTLALHDIILGLPKRTDILNYMIILGKLYI